MSISNIEQKVIPPLKSNPFSSKPLERQQQSLFVGRRDIILELSRLIRSKSPRTILLVGERGSGRTSLIQCLSPHSPKHHDFTLFPELEPSKKVLEELYATLIDFEVPGLTNKLVEQLILGVNSTNIQLPLITFDYGGTPGAVTKEVFLRITQVLKRMNALTIVALTPTQLSAWPEELINEFDKTIKLEALSSNEISDLLKYRIKTEIRGNWSPPDKLIELIENRTGGMVKEVVRLMRDVIEYQRGGGLASQDVIELVESLDIDENTQKIDSEIFSNEIEIKGEISITDSEELHEFDNSYTEIADTSELQEIEDEYYELPVEESEEQPLNEEKEDEINLETNGLEYQKNSNEYIPEYSGGAFGRLAMRNKEALKVDPRIDSKTFKTKFESEYIDPEPPSLEEAQIQTHETSLWISDEIQNQTQNEELNPNQTLEVINQTTNDVEESNFLSRLQSLNNNNDPRFSSEYPLEPNHLRNLDNRELILVDLATKREFSPSDEELQLKLDVGRSRISQLCTPLLKSGILVARISGRSRYYTISNSAKSQLMAWGVING